MTDKDVEPIGERTEEQVHGTGPWWTGLGTWGAVMAMVAGGLAAAWLFLRLPGTPDNLAAGYYSAAKVVAVGLVVAGSTLLGRLRARTATAGKGKDLDAAGR